MSDLATTKQLTSQLLFSVFIICLGSLQFGYHMAELNSPELVYSCRKSIPGSIPYLDSLFGKYQFKQCIELSSNQIGLVTSIFSIGGLLGSIYINQLANKFGRKKASIFSNLLYVVGSFINGISNSFTSLLIGRFISGIGAGFALVITSLYINEVSPVHSKGLLGSMNQLSINFGILFTQLLSLRWTNNNDWRWLLIMGSMIGLLNIVLLIFYVYESPVWLSLQGDNNQAFMVLLKLRGGSYSIATDEVNSWKTRDGDQSPESDSLLENDGQSKVVTLKDYLTQPQYKNSLIATSGILLLQQFDGINSIIFYGVSVLVSIFPNSSIIINCLISVVNVIITFVSANLVDKLGRKPLLLLSVGFLSISTFLMGLGIIFRNSIFSIIGTFTYISFFAIGLGPIPFLLVGEVTQLNAKTIAQSWGTSLNWISTFLVGYSFPILLHLMGGYVYFIFTVMCLFSIWFIKHFIPETKQKQSYEDVWSVI